MNNKSIQKNLWEKIYTPYKSHYFDYWSTKYKKRFIFNELLNIENFNNKNVLELCCGSGENAKIILNSCNNLKITGIDISEKAVEDFKLNTGFHAIQADITEPIEIFKSNFDIIYVLGGIHHCTQNLDQVFLNIANMLKNNGCLIMHEPNSDFFLEPIRKFWYSRDSLFDSTNEHALDHNKLFKQAKRYGFESSDLIYNGGPGFFFILQSMILRIPMFLKNILSPFFYAIEIIWNKQNMKFLNNTFMSKWIIKK